MRIHAIHEVPWGMVPEPAVRDALSRSFLAELPADAVRPLLSGAVRAAYPSGSAVHLADGVTSSGLVVQGLLRASLSSPEGRRVALWYLHVGDVFGITSLFDARRRVDLQALTDCRLLRFDARTVAERARTDGRVGWAIASEVARRLARASDELASASFGTVKQRVARHLLAFGDEEDGRSPARVTQQTIADSIGTVREVVARSLGELRSEGLVPTGRAGVVIRDPDRLRRAAAEIFD